MVVTVGHRSRRDTGGGSGGGGVNEFGGAGGRGGRGVDVELRQKYNAVFNTILTDISDPLAYAPVL